MLVIILNWIYVISTAFCVGYAFDRFVERVLHYSIKRTDAILMSGLIIATVYAQVWSLFGGVSLAANVTLMVFCLAVILVWRKRIVGDVRRMLKGCSIARLRLSYCYF